MPKVKVTPYDASAIRQLRGLEAVRARPGMYIGDVSNGDALHHLIEEVVANSVDEHLAGHCDHITVVLFDDGRAVVQDNGRGIPVDLHAESGISALELVMCHLHAGGKFGKEQVSAGLHGVGVSAVNAVSAACSAFVARDGKGYLQDYVRGVPTGEVKVVGKAKDRGTTITWLRDLEIFSGVTSYDTTRVMHRLEELAFLNAGLRITLSDRQREPLEVDFLFEGGLPDYLSRIVGKRKLQIPILGFRNSAGSAEVAFTWVDKEGEDVRCYANNTYNVDGGTHLLGFKHGLTRIIQGYAKEHGLLKGLGEEGITGADIRDGMIAVVSIKLPDISFSSQTKDKLVTPRAKNAIEDLFTDQFQYWLKENPGIAARIANRAVLSAKAREAARKARDQVKRKDWLDVSTLPGKLSDCQSKNAAECELFLVEGDSAGGSAKGARDRKFQAILPLRGKVLNVERATTEALLENKEIGTIITAIGCGIEQNETFSLKKLRYHKIILMADADVDGAHIRTLLLTLLYRTMPRLIYNGHIYIAMPPLYGVKLAGKIKYFATEEELTEYKESMDPDQAARLRVTRYKGLGEMNAEDLAITTMDPVNRHLKQVTIHDAIEAEMMFDVLMGDDVVQRREFIETHALQANLDV